MRDILQAATDLRHQLHTCPELSGEETSTKALLMRFLSAHTSLELVDRGRWFYAVYRAGADKPNIAFRADMDAVAVPETIPLPYASQTPGIAHKCGHDGHMAILTALCMVISREGCGCNVFFLFQHAEENGQGALECLDFLKENRIEEIFALHNMPGIPLGTVAVRNGVMCCASTGLTLSFGGSPSHASHPEHGRNPAFAASRLVLQLPELARGFAGLVRCTVVQMAVGEANFGISPGAGKLLLTLRAEHERELQSLCQKVEEAAAQLAARDGLTLEVAYQDAFPETANHPESAARVRAACKALGIPLQEDAIEPPMRASEDFGHYLKQVKGAIFMMGLGDASPLHTPQYDFADAVIEPSVKLFRLLAGAGLKYGNGN